jgi:bifunctional DNA-binding transcriptional regulator/antitoxin component of YhaV-PrlF toxin-antitoxin module
MKTYEVEVQRTDGDEMFIDLPDELLKELNWKEGDELEFQSNENGKSFTMKRVKYESVELEFSDEELFKYMRKAHEMDMSFNEWVAHVLKDIIKDLPDAINTA